MIIGSTIALRGAMNDIVRMNAQQRWNGTALQRKYGSERALLDLFHIIAKQAQLEPRLSTAL